MSARRPAFVRTNWQQSTAAAVPSESVISRSSTGPCGGGGDGSNVDDDRSRGNDVKDKEGSGVRLSAVFTASCSVAAAAVGDWRAVAMTGVEESPERAAKRLDFPAPVRPQIPTRQPALNSKDYILNSKG